MAYWNDGVSRWGQAYWDSPAPISRKSHTMAIITTKSSKLSLVGKCQLGTRIVQMSTNNPDAPGNAAALAIFSAANAALIAAQAAFEENRQLQKQLSAARDEAEVVWNAALSGLAGVTESVTGGVAAKILSTGFGVRAEATPTQPVGQVENVKVAFTGEPGHSEVTWKPDANATGYVLECGDDPDVASSFKYKASPREARWEGNGAVPGQQCWFRVAAVNRLGQGPYSEPALRPVM
jgi:hypothetical protein